MPKVLPINTFDGSSTEGSKNFTIFTYMTSVFETPNKTLHGYWAAECESYKKTDLDLLTGCDETNSANDTYVGIYADKNG